MTRLILLAVLLVCSTLLPGQAGAQPAPAGSETNRVQRAVLKEIQAAGDLISVDGKPFMIKGVSYSPFYPGEANRDKIKKASVADDMKKMRELGINTIIIYWVRSEEVYREARANGIMILQGISIIQNPPDFQDEQYKIGVKRQIKHAIDYVHNVNGTDYSDTILGFWLGGELDPDSIKGTDDRHPEIRQYDGGYYKTPKKATATECFFAEMCDYGRKYADQQYGHAFLFSHINWPPAIEWLRLGFLDYTLCNVYSFWPPEVVTAKKGSFAPTGYQGYIENLKKNHPKHPVIISEFGYSTAPDNPSPSGNNERDQAAGLIARWHDILTAEGLIAGGSVFEWNDEWWKQGGAAALIPLATDINFHERDDAEEWFGIIGIDGESKTKYTVRPKQGYYAVKRMLSAPFADDRKAMKSTAVDAFRGQESLLGTVWEALPGPASGFEVRRSSDNSADGVSFLTLSIAAAAEGAETMPVEYRLPLKKAGQPLDVSRQLHLSFWIRGMSQPAGITVRLESEACMAEGESRTFGISNPVIAYLPKIRPKKQDQWERVNIPLEHFGPLDFSKVVSLGLILNPPASGNTACEVKELEFSPNY